MSRRKFIIIPVLFIGIPFFIALLFIGIYYQKNYINDVNTICHNIGNQINVEKCKCKKERITCPVKDAENLVRNNKTKNKCLCRDGNYTAYLELEFTTVNNNTIKNYYKYTCGNNITFIQQNLDNIPKTIPCWYDKQNVRIFGLYSRNNKSGVPYILSAVAIFIFVMLFIIVWFWWEQKRKEKKSKSNKECIRTEHYDEMDHEDYLDDDLFGPDDLLYTDMFYGKENIVVE